MHPHGLLLLQRARRSIRKRPCCAPWRRSTSMPFAFCACLATTRPSALSATWVRSRSIFSSTRNVLNRRWDIKLTGKHPAWERRRSRGRRPRRPLLRRHHGPRVRAFMHELDEELWKLGMHGKDQAQRGGALPARNGAAFTATANIACDQNQLDDGDDEKGGATARVWPAC